MFMQVSHYYVVRSSRLLYVLQDCITLQVGQNRIYTAYIADSSCNDNRIHAVYLYICDTWFWPTYKQSNLVHSADVQHIHMLGR